MNTDELVRKLAKDNKFQLLYIHTKESGFPIFTNIGNYTAYQILFLNYLNFYHNLYTDIAMEYVSDIVLKDPIYEDAYNYYKSLNKDKVEKSPTGTKKKDNKGFQSETLSSDSFTWVPKRRNKEGK